MKRGIFLLVSVIMLLTGCCDERQHSDLQEKYDNLQKEYDKLAKADSKDISMYLVNGDDKSIDLSGYKDLKTAIDKQVLYYVGITNDSTVYIKTKEKIEEITIIMDGDKWKEQLEKIDEETYMVYLEINPCFLYSIMIETEDGSVYTSFSAY